MLFTCSPVITRLTSPDSVSTWLLTPATEMVSRRLRPRAESPPPAAKPRRARIHPLDRLESRQLDADLVGRGGKAREDKPAGRVGRGCLGEAGLFIGGGNRSARQRATGLIDHPAECGLRWSEPRQTRAGGAAASRPALASFLLADRRAHGTLAAAQSNAAPGRVPCRAAPSTSARRCGP